MCVFLFKTWTFILSVSFISFKHYQKHTDPEPEEGRKVGSSRQGNEKSRRKT